MPDGPAPVEARTPVRVMAVLGALAVVVLFGATVALAVSWPTTPRRSPALPIQFHQYDLATARIAPSPQATFREGQVPAATTRQRAVDAATGALRATWYDGLGHQMSSVDLDDLDELRANPVPLSTTSAMPAGTYQFVLSTVRGDQVAEVLAWVRLEIER